MAPSLMSSDEMHLLVVLAPGQSDSVQHGLHLSVGHGPNEVGHGWAELSDWPQDFLPRLGGPVVAHHDGYRRLPLGRCEKPHHRTQLIGVVPGEVSIELECLLGFLVGIEHHAPKQRWAQGMELVLEGGNHAEVPAATAQPPEEVGVFCRAGDQEPPIGCDNVRGNQIVAGESRIGPLTSHGPHPE